MRAISHRCADGPLRAGEPLEGASWDRYPHGLVGLFKRGSVLLLAVLLVPLLRFIDIDANHQAYAAEGLSKQDSPGVVIDRKERTRFVSRVRAAMEPAQDDALQNDDADAFRVTLRMAASAIALAGPSEAAHTVAFTVPRGTPQPRGPPA